MMQQTAQVQEAMNWALDSWQSKPVRQQATYPDEQALLDALSQLTELPPLVTSWEVNTLRSELALAQQLSLIHI